MRKDLKMRRGKEIAQGAHASMSFLSLVVRSGIGLTPVQKEWIDGSFAKVCLQVDSEAELLAVYDRSKELGLEVHLITDSGRTEFHGVATNTCLAIGPDLVENIDKATGHLGLY